MIFIGSFMWMHMTDINEIRGYETGLNLWGYIIFSAPIWYKICFWLSITLFAVKDIFPYIMTKSVNKTCLERIKYDRS